MTLAGQLRTRLTGAWVNQESVGVLVSMLFDTNRVFRDGLLDLCHRAEAAETKALGDHENRS